MLPLGRPLISLLARRNFFLSELFKNKIHIAGGMIYAICSAFSLFPPYLHVRLQRQSFDSTCSGTVRLFEPNPRGNLLAAGLPSQRPYCTDRSTGDCKGSNSRVQPGQEGLHQDNTISQLVRDGQSPVTAMPDCSNMA